MPYGSDLESVRASWRRLVRRYHPDLHGTDLEKQRVATELVKGLNHAFEQLRRRLENGERNRIIIAAAAAQGGHEMSENDTENAFERVKIYLLDLDLEITDENEAEELVVVEDEENGIKNLVVDCEDPIVVLEQLIMPVPQHDAGTFVRRLLQIIRTLVHGAFALDEEGKRVFFRDTLQLANLDFNELEGSVRALSLAMAENAAELVAFAHG